MSGGVAYVLDEDGSFAKRCNLAMVDLEPVAEEDDLMERLHHHGGDLETKGRIDVLADMTGHDEERLMQLISQPPAPTRARHARQGDPRRLGDLPHEIRQGHAGRIPPRLRGDAHAAGGGVGASVLPGTSRCQRRPARSGMAGLPGRRRDGTMGKVTGFLESTGRSRSTSSPATASAISASSRCRSTTRT